MVNPAMPGKVLFWKTVERSLISVHGRARLNVLQEQALDDGPGIHVPSDERPHLAAALHDGHHRRALIPPKAAAVPLVRTGIASCPAAAPQVLWLLAHVGLVNFDLATQLVLENWIFQAVADAMEHEPSGVVGTQAERPLNLQGTDSVLVGGYEIPSQKPLV